jgi:hypothetical protein
MDQQEEKQPAPEPIEPGHLMCRQKWEQIKEQLVPQQK